MLLYIHIPFCKRICNYCDFFHTACMDQREKTIGKICSDIRSVRSDIPLETIYIGGGTPSILSPDEISDIFKAIYDTFPTDGIIETTFEANPDDITEQYCRTLLKLGVNRLSIGIQSFIDSHLKTMNRRHDGKQAVSAIKYAQKAGFRNITADLIYGLPFMNENEWEFNLDTIIGLGVQHISAYHLTIEEGTVFARKNLKPVSEETSQTHYRILCEKLTAAGFHHYEISNFAKPGYEAVHNSGYWTGKPYVGIGPSAHSFDGNNHRYWQPSDINRWLSGEKAGEEFLTTEQRTEEIIMTSLRTADGLAAPTADTLKKAARFINDHLMSYDNGHLRILPEHFLLSDYIISELI